MSRTIHIIGNGDNAVFPCEATVQGNFKVHVEHKPSLFSKKMKIFELWHNTLFIDRNATVVDFMPDQLDIKKKLKPRCWGTLMFWVLIMKQLFCIEKNFLV